MGGKGSGRFSLIKDWELIDAYRQLKSCRKVGKQFGISGQAVHERLTQYVGVVKAKDVMSTRFKEYTMRQLHEREEN